MSIQLLASVPPQYSDILSAPALEFLATLSRTFNARRKDLLQQRVLVQSQIDAGILF